MTTPITPRRAMGALLLGMLLPFCTAQAHGVWVARRAGEWAVVLGEGPLDDAYKPSAVLQVTAQARDGSDATVSLQPRERNLVLQPSQEAATLSVRFEDGYWSQKADGQWVEGNRLQVPDARKVGYYQMFSRTVIAPSSAASKPLGLPLEIVPQSDPMALKPGGRLRVRVLLHGKPLANAKLMTDYLAGTASPSVRTDRQGYASIKVRSAGLSVVKVGHQMPRTDTKEADEDGYAATLAFAPTHPKD